MRRKKKLRGKWRYKKSNQGYLFNVLFNFSIEATADAPSARILFPRRSRLLTVVFVFKALAICIHPMRGRGRVGS